MIADNTLKTKGAVPFRFHKGYYDLVPDVSMNFQMNRWITYLGESGLEDMRRLAPRIHDYSDWKREFLGAADEALAQGRPLHAAYYYRSAEFFMFVDDPEKAPVRNKFLGLIKAYYGISDESRHLVPYEENGLKGFMPAYRLTPIHPKGTVVLCGGFDSYIDEFLPVFLNVYYMGYDVIAFDGPGQGGCLEDYGMHMTHEWERPMSAILDFFKVKDVCLIGLSLGGCLALRAAAYEPRISRVVCDDIMFDFREVILRNVPGPAGAIIKLAISLHLSAVIDMMTLSAAKKRPVAEWGIKQGMHVMGANSPHEFIEKTGLFNTRDISHMVRQDVLLLAGAEDHYVPVDQFYRQIEALKNARSLTARLFTRAEAGQNHCQLGNFELAYRTIFGWLELQRDGGD